MGKWAGSELLSDPRKRAVYDQHGEEGLKREVAPVPDSPMSFRSVNVTDTDPWKQEEIFSTFFGGGPRKAADIERTLPCTLEELYKGATKKIKVSRNVLGASGRKSTVEEVLTVEIKPGWKKGTKITFPEKGNDTQQGVLPADIVFIVDEKPHSVFKRDGDNLIVTQKVSLAEALTGHTAQLTALDGRNLRVSIDSVITQAHEEVVRGEGMPIQREPSRKGNLIVKFSVKIPKLTAEQKTSIRMLLTSL